MTRSARGKGAGATMTTFEYPSAAFPPPPAVSIDAPSSWAAMDLPRALLALNDTESPADFNVNLVAVASRVSVTAPVAEILDGVHRQLGGAGAIGEAESEAVVIDGTDTRIRSYTVSGTPFPFALFQMETALVGHDGDGSLQYLVQLHATCPVSERERYADVFRSMLSSTRLG